MNQEDSSPVCDSFLDRAGRTQRPESLLRSFRSVFPQKRYEQAMGNLSKVKNRKGEQGVSGKQGEEIGVKGRQSCSKKPLDFQILSESSCRLVEELGEAEPCQGERLEELC